MGTFFCGGGMGIVWVPFGPIAFARVAGSCLIGHCAILFTSIHIYRYKSILKLNAWESFLGGAFAG